MRCAGGVPPCHHCSSVGEAVLCSTIPDGRQPLWKSRPRKYSAKSSRDLISSASSRPRHVILLPSGLTSTEFLYSPTVEIVTHILTKAAAASAVFSASFCVAPKKTNQ